MPIQIVEVGPRDGLQNEPEVLEPSVRAEFVRRVIAAGAQRVEAVSFVHPARVPQMAGAEDVLAALEPHPEVVLAGLALNEKGYDRAIAAGLREVRFSFACTDEFCRRNQNSSVQEMTALAIRLIARARADNVQIGVVLGTSFGCPFEGEVSPAHVLKIAASILEHAPDEFVFADTIGVGVPKQVRSLLRPLQGSKVRIGLHLHNTRNTGYANALVGVEEGVKVLDASLGGIGGCPFAPGATGNIATEDLVYALHRSSIPTNYDLEALSDASRWLEGVLGRRLPGQVYRAGGFP